MGRNHVLSKSLLFTALAFCSAGSAIAMQCDELHQDSAFEDYYYLDDPRPDLTTVNEIQSFAHRLDGNWRGGGLDVNCGISNGESLATITSYDIKAEINQHFLGAIVLRAEKETKRKINLETIFFSPEIEKDRQGLETGFRTYTVEFSSPDTLVFEEKYRVHNLELDAAFTPATRAPDRMPEVEFEGFLPDRRLFQRLIHDIKTVSLSNNVLTLNRALYVNGHFVSQQEWQLEKTY